MKNKNKRFFFLLCQIFILIFALTIFAYANEDEAEEKGAGTDRESGIIIRNNRMLDNPIGIYLGHKFGYVLIQNNELSDNGEAIRWIKSRDPGQIVGNSILNNLVGIKIQDTYSSNDKGLIRFDQMAVDKFLIQNNKIFNNQDGNLVNTTGQQPILSGNIWDQVSPVTLNNSTDNKKQGRDEKKEAGQTGNVKNTQTPTSTPKVSLKEIISSSSFKNFTYYNFSTKLKNETSFLTSFRSNDLDFSIGSKSNWNLQLNPDPTNDLDTNFNYHFLLDDPTD